jgi:hypothetical protein
MGATAAVKLSAVKAARNSVLIENSPSFGRTKCPASTTQDVGLCRLDYNAALPHWIYAPGGKDIDASCVDVSPLGKPDRRFGRVLARCSSAGHACTRSSVDEMTAEAGRQVFEESGEPLSQDERLSQQPAKAVAAARPTAA